GQEAALEPLVAVGDERRSRVVDPDPVQQLGSACPCQLLVEDRLLDRRRPAAAVLARPGEPDVAGVVESALPVAQEGELLGERRVVVRNALAACRPVVGQPRAQRCPEACVLGRVGEVHDAVYHPAPARCYIGTRCASAWSGRSSPGIPPTMRPGPRMPAPRSCWRSPPRRTASASIT